MVEFKWKWNTCEEVGVVKTELSPSVPEADRGPRAGSPRGVVVATGQRLNRHDSYDQRRVERSKTQVVHSAGRYRSRY
jgi:hypothetical protein